MSVNGVCAHVVSELVFSSSSAAVTVSGPALLRELAASPAAARAGLLSKRLVAHLAEMMDVDAASLDKDEPVTAIGLSSMHTAPARLGDRGPRSS